MTDRKSGPTSRQSRLRASMSEEEFQAFLEMLANLVGAERPDKERTERVRRLETALRQAGLLSKSATSEQIAAALAEAGIDP